MSGYRENKWVTIRTRRKSRCVCCRRSIPKNAPARYNPASRVIVHQTCRPPEAW